MVPMICVFAMNTRSIKVFPVEEITGINSDFLNRPLDDIRISKDLIKKEIVWKTKNHVSVSLSANAA